MVSTNESLGPLMGDKDFKRISEFIHSSFGIKLPPAKKIMLEGRLRKRLRSLGLDSFKLYCEYLFSPEGMKAECTHMVDVVTTNKTDFFREGAHFDYLVQNVLPELVGRYGLGVQTPLNVWSSACSTGEEPYTLAMVLHEFAESCPGFSYSIFATDISSRVLEKAIKAIYDHDRILPVPLALRKKYLLKGKNGGGRMVRIVPALRSRVSFRRLNLMDEEYHIREMMSVVFCRNVLIYFDRPTQEMLLARICNQLIPGGYLFTGHSETLHRMELPLIPVATTVYRKILIPFHTGLPVVFLKPGEAYVSERPTVVTTVLGSCVSITFFSPGSRLGAICHTMLPKGGTSGEEFKYVDLAVKRLLYIFERYGVYRHEIEIKLFGGSNILVRSGGRAGTRTIGEQNIRAALAVIEEERLTLISADTGGSSGRKIIFYTHTGKVLVKRTKR